MTKGSLKKNIPKSGKNKKKGGGRGQRQKSQLEISTFLDEGGARNFKFIPNINVDFTCFS